MNDLPGVATEEIVKSDDIGADLLAGKGQFTNLERFKQDWHPAMSTTED